MWLTRTRTSISDDDDEDHDDHGDDVIDRKSRIRATEAWMLKHLWQSYRYSLSFRHISSMRFR